VQIEQRQENGSATELLSLDVKCDRRAPAFVREVLVRMDGLGSVLDDALLVASELVTNAVVHSGGSPEDVLRVTVTLDRDGVVISVDDPGLSGLTARKRPHDLEPHGWGLHIVQQLASQWGSERQQGYRVWAELLWRPEPGGASR
jgi:anti-sigma regulatory factor (Ser/Thr protein kinase)